MNSVPVNQVIPGFNEGVANDTWKLWSSALKLAKEICTLREISNRFIYYQSKTTTESTRCQKTKFDKYRKWPKCYVISVDTHQKQTPTVLKFMFRFLFLQDKINNNKIIPVDYVGAAWTKLLQNLTSFATVVWST